jgi:hypothetical protein
VPENEWIAGNPLVADTYVQVRDLLIQGDKGNERKKWSKLRNRPNRKNQAIIMMKKCERWNNASFDKNT